MTRARRLWDATRAFLAEEEGGQALILVLSFLIPMVLAMGLVVRTDRAVVSRMQTQTACDASALAAGNMYARTLNQVAINNLQILKIASFQTAMLSALFGEAAVFYKLVLAERFGAANAGGQNIGSGKDPDRDARDADRAAVQAAQNTRNAQANLRRLQERRASTLDPGEKQNLDNQIFAARQQLDAAQQAENDAANRLRDAQNAAKDPKNRQSPEGENKKWGEIGKTWNAFKCWRNVWKIAWPACREAIKAAIEGAETIIVPILAGIVAGVACPIAATALLCMICEIIMLGEYLLILEWWAVEFGSTALHGYQAATEGTRTIERLSRHSKSLVDNLPSQMDQEMKRVAKLHGCDAAFLVSPDNFRTPQPLDVSKTVIRGGLFQISGLALYGFNGAKWPQDALTYTFEGALNVPLPFELGSTITKMWKGSGATANREIFVSKLGKKTADLDWNAGMMYFEGPAPDTYETKFPWSEIFKLGFGKKAKDLLEKNLNPKSPWSVWDFVLTLLEISRTTTKVLSGKTAVPRGPILWYLQWITDVHFGNVNWFTDRQSLDEGHAPLGNPDTMYPTCYNVFHIGCDGNRTLFRLLEYVLGPGVDPNSKLGRLLAKVRSLVGGKVGQILAWIDNKIFQPLRNFKKWLNDKLGGKLGACQFLPCNPDWTTYSAEWAKMFADFAALMVTPVRFNPLSAAIDESALYFLPANGPQVDFVVAARRTNQEGFFARLFPAKGAMGDSNYWAASKFRLYNPAEVHGMIDFVEPDENGIAHNYPENMMSQDWRAKLIPVDAKDLHGPPPENSRIFERIRH